MLRFVVVTLMVVAALAQEELYQGNEEVLVAVEDLPPGTLVRVRRQVGLFGGVNKFPGGGFNQQVGYRGSVFTSPSKDLSAWGSMSQSFDRRGFGSPISHSGGLDLNTAGGHGLSLSGTHIPRTGSQATLSGTMNVLNTPAHNVNAFASHTKTFDPHFREIGQGSSQAGLGYQHQSGAGLNIAGTHTPGAPNTGSITSTFPLFKDKTTNLNLNTQSNFAAGQKPIHGLGVNLEKKF